ncbi:chemotaxis protein CheB [Pedobacter psychroterrae]|uniref:histidine kinase n=1 Tax=Pedobacter psychroterrae TaxID=2530453 RepID=A0A4V2ML31_9SPHI|nr:chemotaxis protein CheB [Pedobacter psychroterrae]TCD00487.1 chemotaxis protein CheR [Pedobacter psychroterrae]
MINDLPKHIIAIGASAGGMDEINIFFDNTPLDGVAYVIMQHLPQDFKSRMVELLARHSKLEVKEATQGVLVVQNIVYLIPSNKFMTIVEGRLHLSDKGKSKGPHMTIDTFFDSLATDCGQRAIGVVLSGLGADGSQGAVSIHKNGGLIIVRTPETSEFSSMPAHAIATGMADFILEPQLMPAAIATYVIEHGEQLIEDFDEQEMIEEIIALIGKISPLDFSGYKHTTILRRIKKRAAQENYTSLKEYLNFLKGSPEGLITLASEFLISVTGFFRDADAFATLSAKVIPELLNNLAAGEELKVWVAGSASGEEAYSIAISIAEQLIGSRAEILVKIFATDLDGDAMALATKGIYTAEAVKGISAERLQHFFVKEGGFYRVVPLIRKMVIFAKHDLAKNPPYCNMHLISCRNLLIYMMPVLQKKIFSMLLFGLRMRGYLFLGSSEIPTSIIDSLETIDKRWKIYRNIKSKRSLSYDAFSLPELPEVKSVSLKVSNVSIPQFGEFMSHTLALTMGCLVIFIDESYQVIKSFGDSSKFLLQENFNTNLTELLHPQLAVAFNTLAKKVLQTDQQTSVAGIPMKSSTGTVHIDLSIAPVPNSAKSSEVLMVILKASDIGSAGEEVPVFNGQTYQDQYTQDLEHELKQLKASHQKLNQQVDASNENMQSFNEELVSANEEMQSTNEEMQSVNEELHTINSDYQLKNRELLEINDDLNNYFRSNINGQLFINSEMLLMKFSPGAVKLINLRESDIGRPIYHISTNIRFETILDDINQVTIDGSTISKQIQTNDGRWYQMMIMPYLQQLGTKRNGTIVTFGDITELKDIQFELDRKNQSLQRINEDLDNFIHTASHDLLAPLGNIEASIDVMNSIALSDPKFLDVINLINRSIKNYRQLITDISIIAKIESEIDQMDLVNIEELVRNVEWSLEDKIRLSGATIQLDLEVKELKFSKKNLRSILFNLVCNAIKFKGADPPVIKISSYLSSGRAAVSIMDNGKGIDEKGLGRIFEMYGRLHQDIEGTGIGLYLAKKIINASGGKLEVESKIGQGSMFTIFFA